MIFPKKSDFSTFLCVLEREKKWVLIFERERGFGCFDVKVNGCAEKKKWLELLFMMTGGPVRDRRRWRCFGEDFALNGRSC